MKYFGSKLLIILCTVLATIGVWAALAWPTWHAAPPDAAASAVVEPVATISPPRTPEPVPATPQPTAPPPEPPVIVRRIVYVPSSEDSASEGAAPVDAAPAPGDAEPPADYVPGLPDAAPIAAAPSQPDSAPAPQPVATQKPPAPVKTPAPTPAPTPIESGGS